MTSDSDSNRSDHEGGNVSAASTIRLDQFLQLCGAADSGGHAKYLIQNGEVLVNGDVETRRRRKLTNGDVVRFGEREFLVDEFWTGQ